MLPVPRVYCVWVGIWGLADSNYHPGWARIRMGHQQIGTLRTSSGRPLCVGGIRSYLDNYRFDPVRRGMDGHAWHTHTPNVGLASGRGFREIQIFAVVLAF